MCRSVRALLETLREYWRWKKPKHLFVSQHDRQRGVDQPISDKTVWYACKKLLATRASSKRVSPHTLAAQLRHPPAGGGHRSAHHSDSAGPRRSGNDSIYLHLSQRHLQAVTNPLEASLYPASGTSDRQLPPQKRKMTRPTVEVADILRAQGDRFLDRYRSSFDFQQLKAFRAIQRCRTAALGGHRDACPNCGHQAISYNSCRNRHCPKCQAQARERWLAARERELLTTSYFHVVFTVPHELNVLALGQPTSVLRSVVHRQRANLARNRSRSQTPGSRDRRHQHSAHLGTEPAPPSPHSLRHSRGRTLAGSPSMGPSSLSFLLARQGPQPRLSRQVPRRL